MYKHEARAILAADRVGDPTSVCRCGGPGCNDADDSALTEEEERDWLRLIATAKRTLGKAKS